MQPRGRPFDVLRLPARMPVGGDLVREVPGDDRRMQLRLAHADAHATQGEAHERRGGGGPVAGRVDRPDALPDEDARGVEALEQPGVERVLRARRVRVDRLQLGDEPILVGRGEGVAVTGRVLRQRGAVQLQPVAVEIQPAARPPHLAQPDARPIAALAADRDLEVVQIRAPGSPQDGVGDRGMSGHRHELAVREAHGGERDRSRAAAARERRARGDDARRAVVAHLHAERHVGLELPGRRTPQRRLQRRRPELALADRPDADLAVEAAEVEPRSMEAGLRLGVRVTPVDADDERMDAGAQDGAVFEREELAGVRPEPVSVEPGRGQEVGRLEVQRVEAGPRDAEVRPVPGDRAVVVGVDAGAAHGRRIDHVGDGDPPSAEGAALQTLAQPDVARIEVQHPGAQCDPSRLALVDRRGTDVRAGRGRKRVRACRRGRRCARAGMRPRPRRAWRRRRRCGGCGARGAAAARAGAGVGARAAGASRDPPRSCPSGSGRARRRSGRRAERATGHEGVRATRRTAVRASKRCAIRARAPRAAVPAPGRVAVGAAVAGAAGRRERPPGGFTGRLSRTASRSGGGNGGAPPCAAVRSPQRPRLHPRHQRSRAGLGQRLVEVSALRRLHAGRAALGARAFADQARASSTSRSNSLNARRVMPTPPGWPS